MLSNVYRITILLFQNSLAIILIGIFGHFGFQTIQRQSMFLGLKTSKAIWSFSTLPVKEIWLLTQWGSWSRIQLMKKEIPTKMVMCVLGIFMRCPYYSINWNNKFLWFFFQDFSVLLSRYAYVFGLIFHHCLVLYYLSMVLHSPINCWFRWVANPEETSFYTRMLLRDIRLAQLTPYIEWCHLTLGDTV